LKKKIYIYVLVIIVFLVGLYFLGTRIMAVIGFILATLGFTKSQKKKLKEAKDRIDKAGEDIEAKKHDADSALDFYDDFFADDDGE